jgi:ribonuclease J
VNRIINAMIDLGVEVITDRNKLVHVSGHPRRGELARMYQWLNPEVVVPVHGEALHLSENAALARSLGVREVVVCGDGDVVRLAPAPAQIIDEIPAGRLYRDGNLLVDSESRTLPDRRRLGFAGIVSVAVAVTSRGDLVGDPWIEMTGLPVSVAADKTMEEVVANAVEDALSGLPKGRRRDPGALEQAIERSVRGSVNAVWGKKPLCHVMIVQV